MATSAPRSAAGRGRGRARMLGSMINNPGENGQPIQKYIPINNTQPTANVDTFKPVDESLNLCLRETTQDNLKSCLSTTDKFAKTDEEIKKVVSSLFEKCLGDQNLAASGGQVAAILISSEKVGPTFRNIFLKKVNADVYMPVYIVYYIYIIIL